LPEVDAEHRNLFRLAGEIHQAARPEVESARMLDLARQFESALEEHFNHEERLMRSASYEIYDWHKLQHDTARSRIAGLIQNLEAGNRESAVEYLEALARWFRDHMAVSDRMMGAHIRNYARRHAAIAS
jgi:hemerythrin